jgi:hypothetical protein
LVARARHFVKVALMCEESITMQPALNINVFAAPEKAMVAERVRPFGPPPAFDPSTSTLIFGEHDAVLVDTLMTVGETKAPTGSRCIIATLPQSISPTAISITSWA